MFNVLKKGNIVSALRGDRIGTRVDSSECNTWECAVDGHSAEQQQHLQGQAEHRVAAAAGKAQEAASV